MEKMLENNMVHFLGSDVHRQNTIYPLIPAINNKIVEIIGEDKLEEITNQNPKLALKNKRIEIQEPNKIELTLKEKIMISNKFNFSLKNNTK